MTEPMEGACSCLEGSTGCAERNDPQAMIFQNVIRPQTAETRQIGDVDDLIVIMRGRVVIGCVHDFNAD